MSSTLSDSLSQTFYRFGESLVFNDLLGFERKFLRRQEMKVTDSETRVARTVLNQLLFMFTFIIIIKYLTHQKGL